MNQGPIGYEPTALTTELCPHTILFYHKCQMALTICGIIRHMERIKTELRRLRYYSKKDIFTFTNIATAVALIFAAGCIYSTITATTRNWQLEQKLSNLRLERTRLQIEVDTLELEQNYYNTDEYLEIMARSKDGKMLEGETMVVLPKNSEKAINKYADIDKAEKKRNNFQEWLDFLFS